MLLLSTENFRLSLESEHLHEKPYFICCTTLSRKAVKGTETFLSAQWEWPQEVLCQWFTFFHQWNSDLSLTIGAKWFMQDRTKPYFTNVMNLFCSVSGHHVISHQYPKHHNCRCFWPWLSPNSIPYDFLLVGFQDREAAPKESW